jgi:hypothetical protein
MRLIKIAQTFPSTPATQSSGGQSDSSSVTKEQVMEIVRQIHEKKPNIYSKALVDLYDNKVGGKETIDNYKIQMERGGIRTEKDRAKSKHAGEALQSIAIQYMLAMDMIYRDPNISTIFLPASDQLRRLKAEIDGSEQLKPIVTSLISEAEQGHFGQQINREVILQGFKKIKDNYLYVKDPIKPIREGLAAGIKRGVDQVEALPKNEKIFKDSTEVIGIINGIVPSEYYTKILGKNTEPPKKETIETVGEDLTVLVLLGLNRNAFVEKEDLQTAQTIFMNHRESLVEKLDRRWESIIPKDYKRVVDNFLSTAGKEASPTAIIRSQFMNFAKEGLADNVDEKLLFDLNEISKQFYNYFFKSAPKDEWPDDNRIKKIAQSVRNLLLATMSKDSKKAIPGAMTTLEDFWPSWQRHLNGKSFSKDGPMSVLLKMGGGNDHYRLSPEQYSSIFTGVYEKLKMIVQQKIDKYHQDYRKHVDNLQKSKVGNPESQLKNNSVDPKYLELPKEMTKLINPGYLMLYKEMVKDPFALAKVRLVDYCFRHGDEKIRQEFTAGSIGRAQMLVEECTSSENPESVNENELATMTDDIINHISSGPYGTGGIDSPKAFIFASQVLWMLYNKSKGIR